RMRGMLTSFSRPLVVALSMLVLVSGSGAAAASTRPPVIPVLRAVPGSALPALRGAARVAPTAAARPIDVTVSLKPRNASLLAYSVTGLDTATKLQSLATGPELTPHTTVPTPSCSGPNHAKSLYGGYLPGDLATAYAHRSLIEAGNDGSGESIALVEFSNY